MMTTWKLAPALAAGCTVVLKPDSATPLTALRMAELAAEVGFPPGAINVVPGAGKTIGAYLVRHPGVDKIAFTGSTETGGEIMRMASDPIKRITLELGGKSPNIVFADADLADAIPSSVWSIYYSAGQSCEARSRILVEQSAYDDFVSRVRGRRQEPQGRRPARGRDPGRLAHLRPSTATRCTASSRRAARKAPRSSTGGEPGTAGRVLPADRARRREPGDDRRAGGDLRPGCDVISVRGREGRDPACERRPLRADGDGLDGRSRRAATGSRGRSRPGTVGINMPYTAFPGIPFGGYKQSGFGRELGLETLELYLETKSVLVSTSSRPFNPFGL